jgi:hypothetical protein
VGAEVTQREVQGEIGLDEGPWWRGRVLASSVSQVPLFQARPSVRNPGLPGPPGRNRTSDTRFRHPTPLDVKRRPSVAVPRRPPRYRPIRDGGIRGGTRRAGSTGLGAPDGESTLGLAVGRSSASLHLIC